MWEASFQADRYHKYTHHHVIYSNTIEATHCTWNKKIQTRKTAIKTNYWIRSSASSSLSYLDSLICEQYQARPYIILWCLLLTFQIYRILLKLFHEHLLWKISMRLSLVYNYESYSGNIWIKHRCIIVITNTS